MEENYFLAKKAVDSKYSDSSYYSLFLVSLYALLEKYSEYKKLILTIFKDSVIYIEEDDIQGILDNHNLSFISFSGDDDMYSDVVGISSPKDIVLFEDGDLKWVESKPLVVCSSLYRTNAEILNVFLHEMNHVIKGYLNSFYFNKKKNNTYYIYRVGLSMKHYRYNKKTGELWKFQECDVLDEAINTIQATELAQSTLVLKHISEDERVLTYLNKLNKEEINTDFGYEMITRFLRPLWKNESFRRIIEDNIVEGSISTIIKEYDSIMGKNAFESLARATEIVEEADKKKTRGKKYKAAKKYIKNAAKKFPKEKRKIRK